MFNGGSKETVLVEDNVNIVETSAAAFKEFLQLIHALEVKFTMDNIDGVMMLVEKYDVAHGWPMCVKFLKDSLEVKNILWGLHLALRFSNDDSLDFCMDVIRKNIKDVHKMFKFDGSDKPKLRSLADMFVHRLSDKNLANIHPLIQSAKYLTPSEPLDQKKIGVRNMSFTWTTGEFLSYNKINEIQEFEVHVADDVYLTDICFSKLFQIDLKQNSCELRPIDECKITIWIRRLNGQRSSNKEVVFQNFKLKANEENRFKLSHLIGDPINGSFCLYTKIHPYRPPIYAYNSNISYQCTRMTSYDFILINPVQCYKYATKLSCIVSALQFEKKIN